MSEFSNAIIGLALQLLASQLIALAVIQRDGSQVIIAITKHERKTYNTGTVRLWGSH
jgi:hypothetical protein